MENKPNKLNDNYRYKSYTNLKKRLGEYDAIIECNELAIREFQSQMKSSITPNFLKSMSNKHGVRVDALHQNGFNSRVRLLYILSVSQQADQFFDEFREEYKSISSLRWGKRNDGESELDYILRTIIGDVNKGKNLIGAAVYEVYNYYRLVRNNFVHSDNDYKKVDAEWRQINHDKLPDKYKIYNSPKKINEIDFDDFILYSIIIKHIASKFCVFLKPSLDELALKLIKDSDLGIISFKIINKYKNNEARYIKALQSFLKTNYGEFSPQDVKKLALILNNVV